MHFEEHEYLPKWFGPLRFDDLGLPVSGIAIRPSGAGVNELRNLDESFARDSLCNLIDKAASATAALDGWAVYVSNGRICCRGEMPDQGISADLPESVFQGPRVLDGPMRLLATAANRDALAEGRRLLRTWTSQDAALDKLKRLIRRPWNSRLPIHDAAFFLAALEEFAFEHWRTIFRVYYPGERAQGGTFLLKMQYPDQGGPMVRAGLGVVMKLDVADRG